MRATPAVSRDYEIAAVRWLMRRRWVLLATVGALVAAMAASLFVALWSTRVKEEVAGRFAAFEPETETLRLEVGRDRAVLLRIGQPVDVALRHPLGSPIEPLRGVVRAIETALPGGTPAAGIPVEVRVQVAGIPASWSALGHGGENREVALTVRSRRALTLLLERPER
jgi:hypothetical protein